MKEKMNRAPLQNQRVASAKPHTFDTVIINICQSNKLPEELYLNMSSTDLEPDEDRDLAR